MEGSGVRLGRSFVSGNGDAFVYAVGNASASNVRNYQRSGRGQRGPTVAIVGETTVGGIVDLTPERRPGVSEALEM